MVADESYKRYLNDKLELIFNDNGMTVKNNLYSKKNIKSKDLPKRNYTTSTAASVDEVLRKYPNLNKDMIKHQIPNAIKLQNGIMGVKIDIGEWYFPELDFKGFCKPNTVRLFENGYFSIGTYIFNKNRSQIYHQGEGEVDLYDNQHFIVSSDGENRLVDFEGKVFEYDGFQTSSIEPRKQCILLREGIGYYNGMLKNSYKVLLKNGKLLQNGKTYSVVDDEDLLVLSDNMSNHGNIAITGNGSLIDNGNEYYLFSKTIDNFIIAQKGSFSSCDYYSYVINENGKKIIDEKFMKVVPHIKQVGNYSYIKAVGLDHKEYIFDEDGKLFTKNPHDNIDLISEEYAKVKDDKDYKILSIDGKEIHNNKGKPYGDIKRINNCFLVDEKDIIFIPDENNNKANVRRHFTGYSFGYAYDYDGETIYTKYLPVMIYNKYQALLLNNKNEYIMFNRYDKENTYEKLGYITKVHFNDSFIEANLHIYFPYNDALLDITDFYQEKLMNMKKIRVNQSVCKVLTKKQYIEKFKPELDLLQIEADIVDENERQKRAEAQRKMDAQRKEEEANKKRILEEQEDRRRVHNALEKRENDEKRISEQKAKYLSIITDAFEKLEELHVKLDRIPAPKDLFDWNLDHYEIKEDYVNYLRAFDLSKTSFKNVKVGGGINFKGSNATIDPQQVYNKNMSGSNFTGIYFSPIVDFTMANICGSKFSFDDDTTTIDLFNSTIKDAIYDDDTRINNMTIDEYFEEEKNKIIRKN